MGLFGKHKGKGKQSFVFTLHIHTLSPWPAQAGNLCVTYERGGHSGATKAAAPTEGPVQEQMVYAWEEALSLPATLYEDAAAAKKSSGKGLGPFERKDLKLSVAAADSRGKPVGAPLGTVTLNLADYASLDGRRQQAFPLVGPKGHNLSMAGVTRKLLVTVGCHEGLQGKGGATPAASPAKSAASPSKASAQAQAQAEIPDDLPSTLSTDDEGSRPSSRADSRLEGRAESVTMQRGSTSALPSVPEEAPAAAAAAAAGRSPAPAAGPAAAAAANGDAAAGRHFAAAAAAVPHAAARQPTPRYDADGFLVDDSIDGEAVSQEASASVRRNLGSALERAEEASEAASKAAEPGSGAAPEVQSRLQLAADSGSGGRAAAGSIPAATAASAAASAAAAPAAGGRQQQAAAAPIPGSLRAAAAEAIRSGSPTKAAVAAAAAAVPATPADARAPPSDLQSPQPFSTGQQSSLSAAGDPAVPFVVPPSTSTHQRRFAQRDDAGGGSRRWAWRREGKAGTAAAAGAAAGAGSGGGGGGLSIFQRARIASTSSKQEAEGGASASAGVEASGVSASTASDPSLRRSSDEAGAGAAQAAAAAAGAAAAGARGESPDVAAAARISAFAAAGGPQLSLSLSPGQPAYQRRSSVDAAPPGRQRSSLLLRPTASLLLDSLAAPSPKDPQALGAAQPFNLLVAEGLMRELRNLAALESAVYRGVGRRTFSGSSRHLHAPARRLARTILSLGPGEGLAFAMQAIRAIEVTAGAGSGDLHRLTFWWSNVLQLRWTFWALCQGGHGHGLDKPQRGGAAAAAAVQRGRDDAGGNLSPRAALAAAAAAQSAAAMGLDWMERLLPHLRELEGWLFGEMLKHLWWRVLLQRVTGTGGGGSSTVSPGSAAAAAAAAAAGGANGVVPAAARSPSMIRRGSSGGDSGVYSPSALQATPRSFENAAEEAVEHWMEGLREVERALRDTSRPAPAPRPHLALLHRQLIVALLHRLDTLLFRKLLRDEGESPPLRMPSYGRGNRFSGGMGGAGGRSAFSHSAEADEVLGGSSALEAVALSPLLLPFARGSVTFGTGVSLKMAVSRLTSWAADCGVKEDRLPQAARSTEMSDYRLFPCLRATADLLMMPKEVLADPQIRREVVPGLPLHRVCQLLERFVPDDCAPDPLPPGLLEALQRESPRSDGGSTPSPTAKAGEEYLAPAEAGLLADGIIEPLKGLEMDEESDEELESMAGPGFDHDAEQLSPGGAAAAASDQLQQHRFALLHDLWATAR